MENIFLKFKWQIFELSQTHWSIPVGRAGNTHLWVLINFLFYLIKGNYLRAIFALFATFWRKSPLDLFFSYFYAIEDGNLHIRSQSVLQFIASFSRYFNSTSVSRWTFFGIFALFSRNIEIVAHLRTFHFGTQNKKQDLLYNFSIGIKFLGCLVNAQFKLKKV